VKIEVRCSACGKAYLVDTAKIPAAGGVVKCQSCGASIAVQAPTVPAFAPAAPPAPAPAAAPSSEVICPRCGLHFAAASTRPATPSGHRATVLVVEDMEYFLEIAREALRGKYEVKAARSVDEASKALREGPVDIILLDIYLANGEDGLELLRRHPKTCPVLAFTAEDESEMYGEGWNRLLSAGIDDVVRKGMNVNEMLLRKVAAALGETEPEPPLSR
jgi:predicted Zn finger-like uncharacterized protein